jgi:hypothetical protein
MASISDHYNVFVFRSLVTDRFVHLKDIFFHVLNNKPSNKEERLNMCIKSDDRKV